VGVGVNRIGMVAFSAGNSHFYYSG